MVYIGKRKWKYRNMLMSHLIADTLEELHAMAKALGINTIHFQNKPNQPHYDICQAKKKIAISMGVQEISDKQIILILKEKY